jgi:hypothetical protein
MAAGGGATVFSGDYQSDRRKNDGESFLSSFVFRPTSLLVSPFSFRSVSFLFPVMVLLIEQSVGGS